jgi:hypothetical protein
VVLFHCLPTIVTTHKDELYGETYTRTKWGEKTTFEGVIIDEADLGIQFWTTYGVTKGSIVYPARYADGRPLREHRWWKVRGSEPKENGLLVAAVPSEVQPSFAD